MTTLLILAVLVLVAIAIWQIGKIFELSQMGKQNADALVADDADNQTNGYLLFLFLIFIYGLSIFSFVKYSKFLLPEAASAHGGGYDTLMWVSFAVILTVQTLTQALLHYFGYKYRGQKGRKALFYADNDKLEFIWTIIPVVVLAGLIISGLYYWTEIMDVNDEDDPLIVELYAQQFNWTARYAGQDNVLGDASVRLIDIDRANVLGLDESDPNAADDVLTKELYLPVGRKVNFYMRSQDVLHSAYMPHFRAQMNCVPGMITKFSFTPTVTTADMRQNADVVDKVKRTNKIRAEWAAAGKPNSDPWEFDYVLLCNKICGKSHYNMQMKIVVVTEEEYNDWMAEQKQFSESLLASSTPAEFNNGENNNEVAEVVAAN